MIPFLFPFSRGLLFPLVALDKNCKFLVFLLIVFLFFFSFFFSSACEFRLIKRIGAHGKQDPDFIIIPMRITGVNSTTLAFYLCKG